MPVDERSGRRRWLLRDYFSAAIGRLTDLNLAKVRVDTPMTVSTDPKFKRHADLVSTEQFPTGYGRRQEPCVDVTSACRVLRGALGTAAGPQRFLRPRTANAVAPRRQAFPPSIANDGLHHSQRSVFGRLVGHP
jgi:hypothetical protein